LKVTNYTLSDKSEFFIKRWKRIVFGAAENIVFLFGLRSTAYGSQPAPIFIGGLPDRKFQNKY